LPKIRKDQRENNANLAVIVSVSLPKTMEGFDRVDNVWVSSLRHAVPLAKALRQALIEGRIARTASEDPGLYWSTTALGFCPTKHTTQRGPCENKELTSGILRRKVS